MTDDGNPPLGFVGTHNGAAQDWRRSATYEHSISPQDVKYQFTGEASYDLPVGKGRAVNLNGVANGIAGGWTVNAIALSQHRRSHRLTDFGSKPVLLQSACRPDLQSGRQVLRIPQPYGSTTTASRFQPAHSLREHAPAYLDNVRTDGRARSRPLPLQDVRVRRNRKHSALISPPTTSPTKPQFGYPNVPSITDRGQQGLPFGQITNTVNTPRQFQFGARFNF